MEVRENSIKSEENSNKLTEEDIKKLQEKFDNTFCSCYICKTTQNLVNIKKKVGLKNLNYTYLCKKHYQQKMKEVAIHTVKAFNDAKSNTI